MWLNQCTAAGNFLSETPQYPPIVVYTNGEVKTFGDDLPREWRYSFINSTQHFIEIIKNGSGEPIYTGEQGKNLSIFAKMPYISNQKSKIVYWEEITPENEAIGECNVKTPPHIDGNGMTKFSLRKKKDMRKGKSQGLLHEEFRYNYEG